MAELACAGCGGTFPVGCMLPATPHPESDPLCPSCIELAEAAAVVVATRALLIIQKRWTDVGHELPADLLAQFGGVRRSVERYDRLRAFLHGDGARPQDLAAAADTSPSTGETKP